MSIYSKNTRMKKVKKSDGTFDTSDSSVYISILAFVSARPQMSDGDGTALIQMIKEITFKRKVEIPLPSR